MQFDFLCLVFPLDIFIVLPFTGATTEPPNTLQPAQPNTQTTLGDNTLSYVAVGVGSALGSAIMVVIVVLVLRRVNRG